MPNAIVDAVRRNKARWPYILIAPLGAVAGYILAGQPGLIVATFLGPTFLAFILPNLPDAVPFDAATGLTTRAGLVIALDNALRSGKQNGLTTGAIVFEIDRFKLIEERHDRSGVEAIFKSIAVRLSAILRADDIAARLDGPTFAVGLSPTRRFDLEAAIQLASRIQHTMAEPFNIAGMNVYLTVSIGFGLSDRLDHKTGVALLQAANSALIEAQRHAPAAIRSFSPSMRNRIANCNELSQQVTRALDNGEIRAFFQPQISTRTGEITGFETLARWQHPRRGLIPPLEFLPALAQAGQMHRLGEAMIHDALSSLRRWDETGLLIPRVGVNFSKEELTDPQLVDRIEQRLHEFGLDANRLAVEVLETVVADHADDIVIRNLSGLAGLGCSLDLDDFGTGHASITSIRRYSIERIKIDRSFVTRIDADDEQQKMVAAILTMADRLGLDTLAEGVETTEERLKLAELGCGHVQGFGIARPLPPEDVDNWINNYSPMAVSSRGLRRKAG